VLNFNNYSLRSQIKLANTFMPEIKNRPPSFIKIRTMQSDMEEMRSAGGHISGAKILGKRLEEIEETKVEEPEIIEETTPEIESAPGVQVIGVKKKSKILPIIIAIIIILMAGGGAGYYFLILPQEDKIVSTPTPIPTPQFISLLKNFSGETTLTKYQGNTSNLEQIISQGFQKSIIPDVAAEIGFMQDDYNIYPATAFIKSIYNDFSGINYSDIPNFENKFAFIVYNNSLGKNSVAYTLKINEQGLTSFTIANIKSNFGAAFEKLIEENSDILSSQYLQDPGVPQKPFLNKELGAINARYLKFSTGSEFYYGFYQNNLIIATSQDSFQKILELLLPKI
jgi:hypothetical protein